MKTCVAAASRVLATVISLVAGVSSASAQVFPETFSDGVPGPYWNRVAPSPAGGAAVVERNGRLEFTTATSPSYPDYRYAGYDAKDWIMVMQGELRAQATFSCTMAQAGVTATPGSEAGIGIAFYDPDELPLANGLRPGWLVAIGNYREDDGQVYRVFNVIQVLSDGNFWYEESAYAFSSSPTQFRYQGSSQVQYTIPLDGTVYARYNVASDTLAVSFQGYGVNETVIPDALGSVPGAWAFSVGGYAKKQGVLTGSSTFIDNLNVTQGQVQAAPTGFAASDGTFADRVRLTWTKGAGTGLTGYRVMKRALNGSFVTIGFLSASATQFDDTSVVLGTTYEYRLVSQFSTGEWLPVTDTGAAGLTPPANVQATDGTRTDGVEVTWNAVGGSTGYTVLRAQGTAAAAQIGTSATTSFVDTSAVAGTTYAYTVKATTSAGVSASSAANSGWRNIDPPAGVAATDGTSAANVTVTWTAAPGATGYKVFRATGSAAAAQVGANQAASATSFADTSAAVGTTYKYTVQAMTASGVSASSAEDTGWRGVAPPTTVNATDGTSTTQVTVTWSAVAGSTGYKVFRATGSDAAAQVGSDIAAGVTTFADSTATAGTLYAYSVKAKTAAGDSAASATNTGWRNVNAPPNFSASDGTSTLAVSLAWNSVSLATGYKVLRAAGTAAPTAVIATLAAGSTTYDDTSAVAGTAYNYAVRAVTAAGDSASSTANAGWRSIAAPTGVTATDGTSTANVTVTWTGTSGATGYRVFRAIGSATPAQVGADQAASATSFADTSAVAGTIYNYSVKAKVAAGVTAASASDAGWRNVPAPSTVNATDGTSTAQVTVTWSAVAGSTGYRVFRAAGSDAAAQVGADLATGATSFADTTAVAGTTYTYTVKAKTAAGVSASSAGNTGWRNVAAPAGVAAGDGAGTDAVTVTWSAVTGATGYKVLRGAGTAVPSTVVATLGAGAASHADTTAVAGTLYSYAVRAVTASGDSASSTANTGWRNVPAPTGLSATDGTPTARVEVRWTASASTAVTGYKLYRRLPGGSEALLATLSGRATVTYNDTSIPVGVVGTYSLTATVGTLGSSAASATDTGFRGAADEETAPVESSTGPDGAGRGPAVAGEAGEPVPDGAASGAGAPDGAASTSEAAPGAEDPLASDGTAEVDCELVRSRLLAQAARAEAAGRTARAAALRALAEVPGEPAGGGAGEDALPPGCTACRLLAGDIDLDGTVGPADLDAFLAAWQAGDADTCDLDRDGVADGRDLLRAIGRVAERVHGSPSR